MPATKKRVTQRPAHPSLAAAASARTAATPALGQALRLLGGLSPQTFMRLHWQRQPLLVRQALPGASAWPSSAQLLALAQQEGVQSRLIEQRQAAVAAPVRKKAVPQWTLRQGPFASARSLPPLSRPGWTLLVQGVDLHLADARELLERFRFLPDARLDDVMVSWASDGGGVGAHLDSYDVFLLQLQGRRRWRIGEVLDARWQSGVPLKLLQHFQPSQEWLLEPGDMLYLPPGWGHEGTAVGPCMTASVGFRAQSGTELAAQMLVRAAEAIAADAQPLYTDPQQRASVAPALVPAALQRFARRAARRVLASDAALDTALGEVLSEPKAQVCFTPAAALVQDEPAWRPGQGLRLDAGSRMLYDERCVYINGESFRAGGRDAQLMRCLADARSLSAKQAQALSAGAKELLLQWCEDGWVHAQA